MKTLYVSDLGKGMSLNGETFAVQEAKLLETKDKKPYYRVTLIDKTGSIFGQIWSDNISNVEKKCLVPGKVIVINALVEEYKGQLQLNINTANSVDETALDEYMEASQFDLDELWVKFEKYVSEIKDDQIRSFIEKALSDEEIKLKYKIAPAAEYVHHSFRGGLLEHVMEMLDLCQPMKRYYSEANFDLVTAGIIMHDVGKLFELSTQGAVVQRTTEGFLIGHLIKSYEMVEKFGEGTLDAERLLNLKHIILSHHGVLEYGSPVLPATLEAAIVHAVDEASTKVRIYQKVLKKIKTNPESNFSEWNNIIQTRVYKSPLGNGDN